jgi:hypothetical protein
VGGEGANLRGKVGGPELRKARISDIRKEGSGTLFGIKSALVLEVEI